MEEYATIEQLMDLLKQSNRNYDIELIQKAYDVAEKAHSGQLRRSGEPFVSHPVAVAKLLLDMGLDTESLCAALLHDVVEDTDVQIEEVTRIFGADISALVDGVTKLTKIVFSSVEEQQAENLRKMLLAMSNDIRVMLIKLCDRLHNMRTMDAQPEQKRRDKALETMEVYAPIAHRLGISNVKEELEDTSLKYLDNVAYKEIINLINKKGEAESFVEHISEVINEGLEKHNIHGKISSRVKSVYGVYRKMYIQGKSFEEIYDIYAVRIILDTVADCYNSLGVIHDMYHPIPSRFKDYISTPKHNGYQSLHTTVIGHEGVAFEVQIRTWEMHQIAEYGIAAHWKYKAGLQGVDKLDERMSWVRQLLETQRDSDDSEDLLRNIKSELVPDDVFVFTPKGDVINLPKGATVIDFAYAIHSAVGNRMTGAKVNGRIVPIDHHVHTGEIIDIITGNENKGPSRDWLKIVTTSEARNKIRVWFKKERREENVIEGKNYLDREMRRNLVAIPEKDYDTFMDEMAHRQHFNSREDFYAAIGYGGVQMSKLIIKIKDEYAKLVSVNDPKEVFQIPAQKMKGSNGVIIEGIDNCLVKFAKCCSPLPGDEIVGFITRGYGVSIHKKSCANAITGMLAPGESPRWIKAYWADGVKEEFKANLEIDALDREGLFA
ncbi:MAG: bifunctional (p)ppGpp synthetase/guanosine-3',5'-bis(diphosphate) 3'-pyrophosphohydrolase, partial [Oscillospiraceae bacterium]